MHSHDSAVTIDETRETSGPQVLAPAPGKATNLESKISESKQMSDLGWESAPSDSFRTMMVRDRGPWSCRSELCFCHRVYKVTACTQARSLLHSASPPGYC